MTFEPERVTVRVGAAPLGGIMVKAATPLFPSSAKIRSPAKTICPTALPLGRLLVGKLYLAMISGLLKSDTSYRSSVSGTVAAALGAAEKLIPASRFLD